ncbi:hypothetical protein ACWIGI_04080 [Nocardia sp. NPDC055321]
MGEHIAHASTWKEADALIGESLGINATAFFYQLSELVDMIEDLRDDENPSAGFAAMLAGFRRPELRALFEGSGDATLTGIACETCGGALRREKRGRPRRYCRPACRQAANRRRRGQTLRPYELPAHMVFILANLELRQLCAHAHRQVEKKPD